LEGGTHEIVSKALRDGKPRVVAKNDRATRDYDQIYAAAEKQSKMLSGLRRSLSER
jgi:hypothetical protein